MEFDGLRKMIGDFTLSHASDSIDRSQLGLIQLETDAPLSLAEIDY